MNSFLRLIALFFALNLLGACSNLNGLSSKPLYLNGEKPVALILAHGRGKHPAWLVVDPLRKAVNQQLSYHTLSLQMPNDDKPWREYQDDFPAAYQSINEGIRLLQKKGISTIFLMGHSMGARMASAYCAAHPNAALQGLIVAGCRNNGGDVLSCANNLEQLDLPVLDIWGGASVKDVTAASEREIFQSDKYTQIEIPQADHRFAGRETAFVNAVIDWLKNQKVN